MLKKLNDFIIILLILSISFISGCLPAGSLSSSGSSKAIVVWHWMTDRQPAFEELARKYLKETGVEVDFELYAPSDAYTQKVRAAAQGVNLPDIYGILGEKREFASFIKAGYVLNLTPFMEADGGAWKESLFDKALELNVFPAGNTYGVAQGIYGVPIDMKAIKMVYNKDLLRQAGLDPENPPATLAEFLQLGPKFKEMKLQGFVSGWAEAWLIDCLADNYAFNVMGEEKVMRTIRGEVPYTDPDWIKVFFVFKQMQQSGILANGIVTMINKTAEQLFANGKAAFAFNGSWGVNVYKNMNPGLSYAIMLPPKASDEHPMSFWGGAGSSFMVNARSRNSGQAVKFLQWFTGAEQQSFLAHATNNLPANRNAMKDIPPALAQFSANMELATHPNTWESTEFPAVIEAFDSGIQSIIIGEQTPEQVAQAVQKVKERELARKKTL
jgi:raffinose/stachyose/melibiose transport system substrate-binding protein